MHAAHALSNLKPSAQDCLNMTGLDYHFTDDDFKYLAGYFYSQFGIVLRYEKRQLVYSRLVRRLRKLNFTRFSDYIEHIRSRAGAAEVEEMTNALTTNLTSFFREAHHFEHLRANLFSQKKSGLRIWSAGCSSGQEPYSIAMSLLEENPQAHIQGNSIFASDLDTHMIAHGKAGAYANVPEKEITPALVKKYFAVEEGRFLQASPVLKKLVTFQQLNLQAPWPMREPFDAIFCRNVVIYFDRAIQAKLFDRMADQLVPGGWLYIGHSESLFGVTERFKLIGRTIYRKVG